MPTDLLPLRQRRVEHGTECAQTNNVLVLSNDLLGTICFVHQAEEMLSSRNDSFGTSNVCTVRLNHTVQNGLKEIVDHESFPDECINYSNYHAGELSRNMWNTCDTCRASMDRLLSKSVEREGFSFGISKSYIFPVCQSGWERARKFLVASIGNTVVHNTHKKWNESHKFWCGTRVKCTRKRIGTSTIVNTTTSFSGARIASHQMPI